MEGDRKWELALALIRQRQLARELAKAQVKPQAQPVPYTRVGRLHDVAIPETFIDEHGAGVLKEFMVKSLDKGFVVRVYVDGVELYGDSFDQLSSISQEVEEVAAFQSEGIYVLHLSDISFSESLKVVVEPVTLSPTPFRLEEVFWKLELVKNV